MRKFGGRGGSKVYDMENIILKVKKEEHLDCMCWCKPHFTFVSEHSALSCMSGEACELSDSVLIRYRCSVVSKELLRGQEKKAII